MTLKCFIEMRKKGWLTIMVISFVLLSCGAKKKPKAQEETPQTKEEIAQQLYNSVKEGLEYEKEKILLLSLIKLIDQEKVISMLTDYCVYEYSSNFGDDTTEPKLVIERIAQKHSISVSKVASLIFSYKYEMITNEEIEERVIENIEDSRYDEHEEETPDY
jgi:hypothetical protein